MKLKKPRIKTLLRRRPRLSPLEKEALSLEQAVENTPRITTETLSAHREEVLSSARKYIYPLQHSKHKIVIVSTTLFITALVVFFSYCVVALYRTQSASTFLYRVTQVIPFPIARTPSGFVAYENYLFELRHYTHYYETQLKLDFKTESGKEQLAEYKKRALAQVVDEAYIKELAKQNNVTISNQEVDEQIAIIRNQNRLGASDVSFEDALRENFGWSVNDFKRSLRQQLLAQKLVSVLDTATHERAAAVLAELRAGADFGATAKKYSDDPATKDNGGELGFMLDKNNRDVAVQTTQTLFQLSPGQTSEVINAGYALEILKHIETQGDKIRGARILFNFKDSNEYLNPLKDQQKARLYITL